LADGQDMSWVFLAALLLFTATSIRIVRQDQRLVVFRMGRLHSIVGPGIRWIIPLVDRALRVRLDQAVPGWRGQSEDQLRSKLSQRVRSGQFEGFTGSS
jgi:regulator of protease activity HflC (stomatin/prohibitin superfamily)